MRLLLLLVTLLPLWLHAEIFTSAAGGRALSLGNQMSTGTDVFAAQNNPAGLGFVKQWGFGLSAERKFFENGLD